MQRKSTISITCDYMVADKYIGKIDIDGRISSVKCELTDLGNGKYKLIQFEAELPKENVAFFEKIRLMTPLLNNWTKVPKGGVVTAEIDGKNYSGSEIIIDNKDVYVDGRLILDSKVAFNKN